MLLISHLKELGEKVRQYRKERGMTQMQAAGLCNVGIRFFIELENGKETLQIGKVFQVLRGLGLEVFLEERGLPKIK